MTPSDLPEGEDVFPPPPRRSSTAPILPRRSSTSAIPASEEEVVETLYSHPSVKIIAFTANERTSLGSARPRDQDTKPGTLPASSRLERTIAIGAFRIYRAPGSVAFLSCGSALQPILPKSQCWCITEDASRFVLQIRRPQYWRIELPVSTPDDIDRAILLGEVLSQILQFEKTECPFVRNFEVELPEQPSTPARKKAWTAEGKNLISSPFADLSLSTMSPIAAKETRQMTPNSKDRDWPQTTFDLDDTPPRGRELTRDHTRTPSQHDLLGPEIKPEGDESTNGQRSHVEEVVDHLEGVLAQQLLQRALDAASSADPNASWSYKDRPPEQQPCPVQERAPRPRASTLVETTPDTPPRSAKGKQVAGMDKGDGGPSSFEGSGYVAPVNLNKKRMSRMLAGRAYKPPAQLTVVTSPPPKRAAPARATTTDKSPTRRSKESSRETSPGGSSDSFHTVESWHSPTTPLPPSPPLSRNGSPAHQPFPHPHDNIHLGKPDRTQRASSVATLTPHAARFTPSSVEDTASSRSSSPVSHSATGSADPPVEQKSTCPVSERRPPDASVYTRSRLRHRVRGSISRRALSPLPPAANLFTPNVRRPQQTPLEAMRRLPGAIISKTLEMLLGPPIYLVKLMLRVAAKILAGEWRGLVFGFNEGGEKIPVQWDYSEEEFESWEDEDDDYSWGTSSRRKSVSSRWDEMNSKGWEVD